MRSLFSQMEQVLPSIIYSDAQEMANAETGALNLQDDLNFLRTQLRLLSGETNWFDAPDISLSTLAARTNPDAKIILEPVQVSNLPVLAAAPEILLGANLTGAAVDVELDAVNVGYAAQLAGESVLADRNHVELRAINGDPIDAGDGFKLFGKLEVDAGVGVLPDANIDGVAKQFVVKLYKLDATGAMVAATMPANLSVDLIVRRQITLGAVQKDAFVKNASFFDVAQEANIGDLNFVDPTYLTTNATVTANLMALDVALDSVETAVGTINDTDLANLRAFTGSDGQTDTTPDYATAAGVTGAAGAVTVNTVPENSSLELGIGILRNVVANLQAQIDDSSASKVESEIPAGGIAAEGLLTVPAYTVGGGNLDVFYMGQLLSSGATKDYDEVDATNIRPHFTMREGYSLVTVVRK